MLVLNISLYDLAGVGYKIHEAINMYAPGWESRHIALNTHAGKYPIDIFVNDPPTTVRNNINQGINEIITRKNRAVLKGLISSADVIQFNHTWSFSKILGCRIPKDKMKSVYHTGSIYRNSPGSWDKIQNDFDLKFCTYEDIFTNRNKELQILRRPINTDLYKPIKKPHNKIIISHSPSHEKRKGTKYFREAVERLQNTFDNIEMKMIKGVDWKTSIQMKQDCHLFFDQIFNDVRVGAYGLSSIESACFSTPIFVKKDHALDCPFINVHNANEIYYEMKQLIDNRKLMKAFGIASRKYVERYHSYQSVAKFLIQQYESVMK